MKDLFDKSSKGNIYVFMYINVPFWWLIKRFFHNTYPSLNCPFLKILLVSLKMKIYFPVIMKCDIIF